jgi:hypothetical protein
MYREENSKEEKKENFPRCTHCKVTPEVNYGWLLQYLPFYCEDVVVCDLLVCMNRYCRNIAGIRWLKNNIKDISFGAIKKFQKEDNGKFDYFKHSYYKDLKKIQQKIDSEKFADISGGTRQNETEIVEGK